METKIEYLGVELRVIGDYQPEEKEVLYYPDGSGYPGCASSFDLQDVFVENTSVYDLFSNKDLEKITDLVIEKIES